MPSLEQQRAQQRFSYEKIVLLLFCQTKFDKVMSEVKNPKDPVLYDKAILNNFAQKTEEEQYNIVLDMPHKL